MVVKLFGSTISACTHRVMACLFELGLDFELINIDLKSFENKSSEFLRRQPFGQVPAIEDGDFKLFESRAIIRYYATKHATEKGKPNLIGTTAEERAIVDQWLEVESNNFNDSVYNIVLQLVVFPSMGGPTDRTVVTQCSEKLGRVLDVYEERLSESKYLAGDFFSLADLSHLPGLRFLTSDEGGFGHLVSQRKFVNDWFLDICARPAWKKVLDYTSSATN